MCVKLYTLYRYEVKREKFRHSKPLAVASAASDTKTGRACLATIANGAALKQNYG